MERVPAKRNTGFVFHVARGHANTWRDIGTTVRDENRFRSDQRSGSAVVFRHTRVGENQLRNARGRPSITRNDIGETVLTLL